MKKSIVTLSILAAALSSTSVMAVGHIADQNTNDNSATVNRGNVGLVMGNICNQSGNNNDCAVNVTELNGDLNVTGGTTNVNKVVKFDTLTNAQKDSLKGANGKDGIDGTNGLNGVDGKDGTSVTVADNGDGTVTVTGANGDVTITQGSAYDDAEVKADIAANKNKISNVNRKVIGLTDEVEVAQDDIKANTDAINTVNDYVDTVNDNVYLAAAHARVAHETALAVNEDLVAVVDAQAVNNETQQAYIDNLSETKADKAQVEKDIKDSADTTLTASKDYTDTEVSKVKEHADKVATEAKDAAIEHSDARDNEQEQKFNEYTIEQTKIDNQQFTSIEELYAQGNSQQKAINSNTNRIGALEGRVGKVESDVAGLQQDVTRLNGAIAMTTATAAMVLPQSFNGTFAAQVGVGHYAGESALALGVITGNEDVALRVTVSGSSADDWNELAYGASANFAF